MSTNDIQVGDTVRIGKGKVLWRVQSFWWRRSLAGDTQYAALGPRDTTGYSTTSVRPYRLTVITKAGAP